MERRRKIGEEWEEDVKEKGEEESRDEEKEAVANAWSLNDKSKKQFSLKVSLNGRIEKENALEREVRRVGE